MNFDVKGFVTPMSQMNAKFISLLKENYEYAFTLGYGNPLQTPNAYFTKNEKDSLLFLKRLNIEGTFPKIDSLILGEINECIKQKGILFIYAHKFPDKLSDKRLNQILKLLSKRSDCVVLTPKKAIDYYFAKVNIENQS